MTNTATTAPAAALTSSELRQLQALKTAPRTCRILTGRGNSPTIDRAAVRTLSARGLVSKETVTTGLVRPGCRPRVVGVLWSITPAGVAAIRGAEVAK